MDDLVAAIIHDVKNQLAELALRLERRGDSHQETDIALAASRRLTGLLIAQREHSGTLHVNIDSACPGDLLKELAVEYRAIFPNLEFTVEADNAPSFWFYDEALLHLALGNAIHNACRHAHSTIRMMAREHEGQLELTIADDGPGFPDEMLAGETGAAPTFASRSGTGLGLYLAAKIARLHQNDGKTGNIKLDTNGGAIFLMRLP